MLANESVSIVYYYLNKFVSLCTLINVTMLCNMHNY